MSIGEERAGGGVRRAAAELSGVLVSLAVTAACSGSSPQTERVVERSSGGDTSGNAIRRPPPAARRPILFVGTSISAGQGLEPDSAYPQMIDGKRDCLRLPYDAVNAGVSGETPAGLLRRIDWLLREPFDVVVVETGANDGLRGAPVAAVRANIQQIVDRIRSSRPDAAILLLQMEALPNLGEKYTSEFRVMFPDLARRNGLMLLPFLLDGVAGHRDLNQPDGIHPNMAGERIVAENMWRALRPVLERRLQERPSSSAP